MARDGLRHDIEGQGTSSLGDAAADGIWNRHRQRDEYGDLGSYVGRRGWAHRQAHNIAKTGKALQNQSGMGVKDGGCEAELGIVGLERRCELGI